MPKNKPKKVSRSTIATRESVKRLEKENKELVKVNRSMDEFVAIASHQLRTPATAVKQYLALLLEGYADPLTESQKTFIERAFESNERQLHIVDDILRVTQLDLDKIRMEPSHQDVGEIADEAAAALKSTLERRNQQIKIKKPKQAVITNVDHALMRMVFENLLENASNYSYTDTTIRIEIAEKGGEALITIKDEGVGIDPEDFIKLFEKFSRIPNPLSVESGGTGLGLYWAQKMVRLHGGRISVESELDKGSAFIVRLPL